MNELKAALWTALFSFVTLFGTSLLGWLQDVIDWASGTESFPSLSVLGKFAAAAVVSCMIGFVNWAIRFAQSRLGIAAGTLPTYGPS